jgi:hypothetical protein
MGFGFGTSIYGIKVCPEPQGEVREFHPGGSFAILPAREMQVSDLSAVP